MTKSPLTRHGIILLQTPMTETFFRQSRPEPISEHIATHLATKTKPMTILFKLIIISFIRLGIIGLAGLEEVPLLALSKGALPIVA
jgi:hypothetical protein